MGSVEFHFFLVILLVACTGDPFVPIIIAKRYQGYSHLYETISALGTTLSPVKKYLCGNLIIIGFLFVIFSFGQARAFQHTNWCHILFILGILFFGLGSIMAGIFPEDPQGFSETSSGKIHGISSGIGFMFLILNPLWAVWIEEFGEMKALNGILFLLAVITFVLFMISEKRTRGVLKYTGLFQRLNLVVLYSHLIVNYLWMKK